MSLLKREVLRKAIQELKDRRGVTLSEMQKETGYGNFSRVYNDPEYPSSLEKWEMIHSKRPDWFPPPTFEDETIIGIPLVSIPVFNAGAGEPSVFTDEGYPAGHSSEYIPVPKKGIDDNSFGVKIHGGSMEPGLKAGDIVVVVPSAPLSNGKLCFATWREENGEKLVKRYFRYDDLIVLKSDNPAHTDILIKPESSANVRIYRITKSIREE